MMGFPKVGANGFGAELPAEKKNKRLRWFEAILVTLISFGTPFVSSLYLLKNGPSSAAQLSSARWAGGFVHEVTSLLLVAYVLARQGRRLRDLGFDLSIKDAGSGLWLTITVYLAYSAAIWATFAIHYEFYGVPASYHSGKDFFLHPRGFAVAYMLLAPVFEELIVRAYLMTEITELTSSRSLAIIASVVVQSSYHLYYGWSVVFALAASFLILALYYAKWRRILPCIIAHELVDLYALVRLW